MTVKSGHYYVLRKTSIPKEDKKKHNITCFLAFLLSLVRFLKFCVPKGLTSDKSGHGVLVGNGRKGHVRIRTKNTDFRPDSREPVRTESGQNEKMAGFRIRTRLP